MDTVHQVIKILAEICVIGCIGFCIGLVVGVKIKDSRKIRDREK